jgi:hypothetical protein
MEKISRGNHLLWLRRDLNRNGKALIKEVVAMMERGVQGGVGDSFWRSDIRNEPNIQINLQLVEKNLLRILGL